MSVILTIFHNKTISNDKNYTNSRLTSWHEYNSNEASKFHITITRKCIYILFDILGHPNIANVMTLA
jgi:hypothetical protein